MTSQLPTAIRTWQYSRSKGGIEKHMKINPSARMPTPTSDQHLVRIDACALNPVDHKPAELFIVDKLLNSKPATPGIDFAGRIAKPIPGSGFKEGDLVFGCAGKSLPFANGALSEYALVERDGLARIPPGVSTIDAATVGVAGLTALQSIGSDLKRGSKIFINGGSGGTGIFGIQIAKQKGLWVATTCSSANISLCKSLGADQVIDYRNTNVVEALKSSGHKFDRVIDNIGADLNLYWYCHEYTNPSAKYIMVGAADLGLSMLGNNMKIKLLPGFLGGGRRQKEGFFAQANEKDLAEIGEWMRQGKVRTVIDSKFPFEEAVQAFERLKTGRAKGKVVVEGAK
jgi:NADPH:quinone reductase-like Zn-dependent oxidoreductase